MATNSKPQNLPTIDLSSTGVDVLSPAPNDTDIVMAGDVLSCQLNLSVTSQVMAAADVRQRARGGAPPHRNAADGTRFMRSTGQPLHCSSRFRLRSRRAPVFAGHVSLDEPAGPVTWGGEMIVN